MTASQQALLMVGATGAVSAWDTGTTPSGTVSFSDANRTVQIIVAATTSSSGCLYTKNGRSDKRYIELLLTTQAGTGGVFTGAGLNPLGTTRLGDNTSGVGWNYAGGVNLNGAPVSTVSSFTSGDRLGFAIDPTTGKQWMRKNGTWQGSGDPAAGTGEQATGPTGTLHLILSPDTYNGTGSPVTIVLATLCATSATVVGSVPSGFTCWDD